MTMKLSQQTQDIEPMLLNVGSASTTLNQQWFNVLCLLGSPWNPVHIPRLILLCRCALSSSSFRTGSPFLINFWWSPPSSNQQTQCTEPMLVQRWASVSDWVLDRSSIWNWKLLWSLQGENRRISENRRVYKVKLKLKLLKNTLK